MKTFYTDPTSGEPMYRQKGQKNFKRLTPLDTKIIEEVLEISRAFFPEQYQALTDEYMLSKEHKKMYDYVRARRIINCCFGENNGVVNIDSKDMTIRIDIVKCPLKAECKYYKVICQPVFNTTLSSRELEVMYYYFKHFSTESIANELFISIHTVNNHRKNSLRKLRLNSLEEFIDYAHRHQIFKHYETSTI